MLGLQLYQRSGLAQFVIRKVEFKRSEAQNPSAGPTISHLRAALRHHYLRLTKPKNNIDVKGSQEFSCRLLINGKMICLAWNSGSICLTVVCAPGERERLEPTLT